MSKQHIADLMQKVLEKLAIDIPQYQIDNTKDKKHGDYACNVALMLAKPLAKKPRDVAEMIVKSLPPSAFIQKVEIAGPGFINFFLTTDALFQVVHEIMAKKENYGRADIGKNKKIHIEFVSANPNGPLHVGHGRHAAFGAVVADLLATIGYDVHREYYVNDAGRQMDIVTVSTWLRYLELCDEQIIFPVNAYRGEYVIDMAKLLKEQQAKKFCVANDQIFAELPKDESDGGDKEIYIDALIVRAKKLLGEKNYREIFDLVLSFILKDIRGDLSEFGVNYQNWFSERAFTESDVVQKNIAALKEKGLTYEQDGALWFRATEFGDEKDRVLQRSNGVYTYFANDFAYHMHKFERGFDVAIDVFGADHHGYVPRMRAGLLAQGITADKLIFLLGQFVTLYRNGVQVQMSTRSGSFVTLRELRQEVGNDAARFFYVSRKCEQHIDFDLDLAKSKSNENPVYYIQYAHARICSVFRQLEEKSLDFNVEQGLENLTLLQEPEELQLIQTLNRYEDVIRNAAIQHEPHILTNYLRDLATDFHAYYNKHQFLAEENTIRNARLTLILATRQVLQNGLKLIGVNAPQSM
ncbi:MAG TPA: arginine--tRNA ligase [Gammaproteobacteria bacterium]|jgi:arginyl-tRNA synthetase|nr:arginine--tRNA ligase [Gammaproteobacteria bacterium]